jgi:methionyl aminopeptidase
VAEDAMWAGIAAAARGAASGRGRLTDISYAIESAVRRAGRYGIVDGYGGHGIGTEMHQDPHVLNHGRPGKGPRLAPGLALAIEPMLTMGSPKTVELSDGWTVITRDRSMAVHVEHTMALLPDGVWVLTAPDGGRERLGDLVTSRAVAPAAPTQDRADQGQMRTI